MYVEPYAMAGAVHEAVRPPGFLDDGPAGPVDLHARHAGAHGGHTGDLGREHHLDRPPYLWARQSASTQSVLVMSEQ